MMTPLLLALWLDPDLGTADGLLVCGGSSISQVMDKNALGPACRRCWEEEGATAQSMRLMDAQIFSQPIARSLQPWEHGSFHGSTEVIPMSNWVHQSLSWQMNVAFSSAMPASLNVFTEREVLDVFIPLLISGDAGVSSQRYIQANI